MNNTKNSIKTMFIDIETNGLPKLKGYCKYYDPCKFKYYDTSRIIEIAYVLCNGTIEYKRESYLIKPINFIIKNHEIHGITQEEAFKKGKNINEVLKLIKKDIKDIDSIVAHNILFDLNILLSECFRQKKINLVNIIKSKKLICTMTSGKKYMKNNRNPKLTKLYETLFNKTIEQEHRALSDVIYCKDCYFGMINKMLNK